MKRLHQGMACLWALSLALSGMPLQAKTNSKAKSISKPAAAAAMVPASGGGLLLDNFAKMDWTSARDNSSEIRLSQVAGKGGSALRVAYDLKNGSWVSFTKGFVIDDFRNKALSIWVKGKGANNNLEIKLVDEDDTNYGVKRPILSESGDWVHLTLSEADFSYWWGGDPALGRVKDIYFAISKGDGGAGELLVSDLRLTAAPKEGNIRKDGMIFDGGTKEGWMVAKGEASSINLESTTGPKGTKALAFKYSIPAGQWVSARRSLNADLSGNPSIFIRVKGEGEPNNVEIKLIDRDDSTFGKDFPGLGASGQWQDITIPLSDFSYRWGGDNRLDSSLIRYLDIAVSGSGGGGKIIVGEIKIVR